MALPRSVTEGRPARIGPKAHPEAESRPFVPTPKHPSRAYGGLLLAAHRHEDFYLLGDGTVRVPSRTQDGRFWTVDPEDGTCRCPVAIYGDPETGRHFCHHLPAADAWLSFREAVGEGVSFRIREGRWPGVGSRVYFVDEVSEAGWTEHVSDRLTGFTETVRIHGREVGHALSFAGALAYVVELMADRTHEGLGE